jgi:hypothetical protein
MTFKQDVLTQEKDRAFNLTMKFEITKTCEEKNATKSLICGHFISSPSTTFMILKHKVKMIPAVLKNNPPGGNTIIVQNQAQCFPKSFLSNVLRTFLQVGYCIQSV